MYMFVLVFELLVCWGMSLCQDERAWRFNGLPPIRPQFWISGQLEAVIPWACRVEGGLRIEPNKRV